MEYKTPTGTELRAQRERLGLSVTWANDFVAWPRKDNDPFYWVTNIESGAWDRAAATSPAAVALASYADALNAEEQRRASALITAEQVARVFAHKDRLNMCVLGGDWRAKVPTYVLSAWDGDDWDKRLAALQGWHRELLAAERAAAQLTEPVAPEGVRVEESACGSCTVRLNDIVCFRVRSYTVSGEAKTEIATVISGQHWPAWLARYAADLADYRAAQHAAGEQQRRIDAVRAAEDAVDKARRAEDEAASERCIADNNWETAKRALTTALDALAAAKREAGL